VTVLLALLGALFIGISDFLGGAASRETSPLTVGAVLQLAGLITLAPIAAILGASALSVGDLGLGVVSGSQLSTLALGGVVCALVAIPLVAYESEEGGWEPQDGAPDRWSTARQVFVSTVCGAGFGTYLICIGHTSTDSGLWPTVANLVVAVAVTVPVAARAGLMPGLASAPRLALFGGCALGVADATLTTALQRGPLTVASVLGNLYPLVTIVLGVVVLRERVHHWHAVGIALALAGVVMIAAG
jgi:uncharacterized membrane protein